MPFPGGQVLWLRSNGRMPGLAPSQIETASKMASEHAGASLLIFRGRSADDENLVKDKASRPTPQNLRGLEGSWRGVCLYCTVNVFAIELLSDDSPLPLLTSTMRGPALAFAAIATVAVN